MKPGRRLITLLIVAIIVAFILLGFYTRYYPFKNYSYVKRVAEKYGLNDVAKFSYLDANDPWIEYWLARYLHDHGISSWKTLTRSNNATHIFWYPWGRDFTHGEFPFIPIIGANPLAGLPVVKWVSLIPPIFGSLMVLVGVIYAWRVYGLEGALVAAALLSLLPASTARTYAGFVEKIGVAMPFLLAFMFFYSEATKRRGVAGYAYSIIAGIFLASIAYIWGGYLIAIAALAVTALLLPSSSEYDHALKLELQIALMSAVALVAALPADIYGPASAKYFLIPLAASLLAIIILKLPILLMRGRPRSYIEAAKYRVLRIYPYIAATLLVLGVIAAPLIGIIRGRALFALAWPLRELGVLELSRLAETVAEHASPFSSPSLLRNFLWDTNIMLFLAPVAIAYLFYRSFTKKEPEHLLLAVTSAGLYYAVLGMIYFEQAAAVVNSVAIAAFAAQIFKQAFTTATQPSRSGKRSTASEYLELKTLAAGVVALLIATGTIASAYQTKKFVEDHVAMITGYGTHTIQLGWLYFLHMLRNQTPKDTVVVAWWDYGYQISVGGQRASLADGATVNATQIRLLADFFTATSEAEASKILRDLHLNPNNTLVFTLDMILYNPDAGIVIYYPSIDILKSGAMLHIAEKDLQGFAVLNEKYKQTLIYKLFASAAYHIGDHGVPFPNFAPTKPVKSVYIFLGGQLMPVSKVELKEFKPYAIILGYLFDPTTGEPITYKVGGPGISGTYYQAVILIVYKWAPSQYSSPANT